MIAMDILIMDRKGSKNTLTNWPVNLNIKGCLVEQTERGEEEGGERK